MDTIAVLHVSSRRNSGDGLLTDLTLERIRRACGQGRSTVVLALDPDSFGALDDVRQVGTPHRDLSPDVLRAASSSMATWTRIKIRSGDPAANELPDVSACVAVGGGYLRNPDMLASFGLLINHLPQLEMASGSAVPSVYLPQSIGPLRGLSGEYVKRLLSRLDLVCLRDDRSFDELEALSNTRRFPDLAVMHIAERLSEIRPSDPGGPIVLVGRALRRADDYEESMKELAHALPDVIWATQATGEGSKNDEQFYRDLGVESAGSLEAVTSQFSPSAVVSVRLHGALEALASGVPAVHLSYDRKGWGAYSDLGLPDLVHDARSFEPSTVARQVELLRADPLHLFMRLEEAQGALVDASSELDELLTSILSG